MGDLLLPTTKLGAKKNYNRNQLNVKQGLDDGIKLETPKRALLGNQQNLALPRYKADQHAPQEDLTNVNLSAIHVTRQRVNFNWKEPTLSKLKTSKTTTSPKLKFSAIMPAPISTTCLSSLVTQRQVGKMKKVTTKMIDYKLQQIRVINNNRKEKAGKSKTVVPKTQSVASGSVAAKSYSSMRIIDARNIDEGDKQSLILVSEYVNDIYDYLFQLELEQPIRKHHLANQQAITPEMRSILLDWINEIHLRLHLVTETFYIAVSIIDRYLQKITDTKRSELQLVGATALCLAAKYEEFSALFLTDFVYITDNTYRQREFSAMEIQIFKTLDWNLSHPVPIHFLRRFAKAANIGSVQYAMSKYFLELAAIEYKLAVYKPSEIAAASLFLALHIRKENAEEASGFNDSLWNATLQHYSRYTGKHLRSLTRKIALIARQAPKMKLNAVYRKYQSSELCKASLSPELYGALMDSIIKSDG